MGAGIAAAGFSIVDWSTMGKIAASWVISPLLGGLIAAGFLYAIKQSIIFQEDKVTAAKKWVPLFVSIMTWAFITYLTLKGLKKIWPDIVAFINDFMFFSLPVTKKPTFITALALGFVLALAIFVFMKIRMKKSSLTIENNIKSVNTLFTIPLIFAAALLSFAHGANDVANAIGPLAAINDAVISGGISSKAEIPLWVMSIGAIGIAVGLALYGPKLIRTVGSEITELDQMRAFSVAMAASITVIIASQLGLPVSSTHIAIGGVFGVGFLREWLDRDNTSAKIIDHEQETIEDEEKTLKAYNAELSTLDEKSKKSKNEYQRIVELYKLIEDEEIKIKEAKKVIKNAVKTEYVKRNAIKKIIAAWIITVPAAGLIASLIFFIMRGMLLPH